MEPDRGSDWQPTNGQWPGEVGIGGTLLVRVVGL
jgi:hypothetical protein